ncbi:MAG: cobalt-precorrin-5B (C(1))-methyltransferase CbiD [Oscillospiraceae bacterium]|nr:cobalt-precorrin-5B (C(1))-methyltransferase CbiD [Oscillospiraceae bacterium]
MMNEFVYRGGKYLRCGYTTGSCAAAAAKAAAICVLSGQKITAVELPTPKGITLTLDVLDAEIINNYAVCAVKKDSGDDPDITNGILVYAKVTKTESGITITGGKGIGKVTKPGLDQPVGEYAINSVPRKMITGAVSEIAAGYRYNGGFEIEISIPCGDELAEKTYNPRLGIVGGISVIGTSGIIEPMSNAALVDTIRTELNMRKAEGYENVFFTLGNYSENYIARELPFDVEKSVKCSNFIGDAIDIAVELGFRGVLIIGHIGKLVKLGAGIMNTHSAQADGRMDVLVTCGVLAGADTGTLQKLPDCATVDAALDILDAAEYTQKTLDILAVRAAYYLEAKVKGALKIAAVMFSDKHDILVKTSGADDLINTIKDEYNG